MITNADLIVRRRAREGFIALCVAVSCAALTPAVHAQPQAPGRQIDSGRADARWQPWVGCWEQLRDTVHEPAHARAATPLTRGPIGTAASGDTRVCVEPAEGGAVRLRTEVQGRTVRQETIVADGSRRPLEDEQGCRGWRQAEWSGDGHRLFGRAEIVCGGGAPQAVSQLSLLTADGWFQFEGITAAGRESVRVRRYRRAGGEIEESARARTPSRAFDPDAVREAGGKVAPLVLQAALVETHSRFRLDGRTMLALHEAGVPGDVTDLMVALSYPRRFRVARPRTDGDFVGAGGWIDDPFWRYTPSAYSYWGAGGGWWGAPGMFFVEPGFGGGGGDVPRAERGRVINNQGYTRIEAREPVRGRPGRTSTGSTASTSDAGGSSGSASSGGSSSGGVSSSGYSSGGSSDGGGRTAVPR